MSRPPSPATPLWISHHPPEAWHRCVRVGRLHVCRRCLVLYPAALVVALATALRPDLVPSSAVGPVLWLLPLPATVDWVLEHLGRSRWSPRRLEVVTALAAPALGVALGWWVRTPFAAVVMAPVAVHLACALVAWVVGARRRGPVVDPDWEERFEAEEAARHRRLATLVGVQPGAVTKSMSSSTAPTSDGSRSL